MGLDISHNTWHGAYSAFMRWRKEIAKVAGFPPLELMEGFYMENKFSLLDAIHKKDDLCMYFLNDVRESLPIQWDFFRGDPLYHLLYHSDCDGQITYIRAGKIAKRLRELLPKIDGDLGGHIGNIKEKTITFIEGCELAYELKEPLEFH